MPIQADGSFATAVESAERKLRAKILAGEDGGFLFRFKELEVARAFVATAGSRVVSLCVNPRLRALSEVRSLADDPANRKPIVTAWQRVDAALALPPPRREKTVLRLVALLDEELLGRLPQPSRGKPQRVRRGS